MLKQSKIDLIASRCQQIMDLFLKKTCCFTGHRPHKLSWKFNEDDDFFQIVKERTRKAIVKAINDGYTSFLSGMALGFDTMCAKLVLELKKSFPSIQLECVFPCKRQDKLWKFADRLCYRKILRKADKITVISEVYTQECMIDRNIYMVNNSSLLIALYSGGFGGTRNTIDYAKSRKLDIVYINQKP